MGGRLQRLGVCVTLMTLGLTSEAGAASNRLLARAKQAYDNLDYGKVIPLVNKALRAGLTPEDEVEAYFLLGTVHTIYSRDKQAQEAFLELLNRSPDYEVPADTSPKIREALEQAKAARAAVPSPAPGSPTAEEPRTTGGAGQGAGAATPPGTTAVVATPIDPLAIMTGAEAMQPSVRRRGAPFYSTWWFWTAVGVVVAGGGAGLGYYLLQPRYPDRDFGPIPLR